MQDLARTAVRNDLSVPPARPVIGRLNAWLFRLLDGYMDRKLGRLKRELFADLPDDVVEIGAGTGANLRYYRPGTRLHAIEPSPYMRDKLAARARELGIAVELCGRVGEAIDLPSGSADAVVSTLVPRSCR